MESITKEPINNIFNEQCDLLQMIGVPNFGIYKNNYTFMDQLFILKTKKQPKNLPQNVLKQIKLLTDNYSDVNPEYFHITLNANNIFLSSNERKIGTNFARINLASHPYIYQKNNLKNLPKFDIYTAIYTEKEEIDTIRDSEENDGLRINPNCDITNNNLRREIILHLSQDNLPAISPNNCALLINLNSHLINFYVIILGVCKRNLEKCFVGNYVILPNVQNCLLFNNISQSLINQNSLNDIILNLFCTELTYKDCLTNVLFYFLDEVLNKENKKEDIKNIFIQAFRNIFDFIDQSDNDYFHQIELNNMGNYYYQNILKFLNFVYPTNYKIENFSENLLFNNIKNKYIVELIMKYCNFHMRRVNKIFDSYLGYLKINKEDKFINDIKIKAQKLNKEEKWPFLKEYICSLLNVKIENFDNISKIYLNDKRKKMENKNIQIFQNLCNEILTTGKINVKTLEDIDEPIRSCFYEFIWDYKGHIQGIHKDFGKLSFLQSNEIEDLYYCSNDERYELCEHFQQILANIDEKF